MIVDIAILSIAALGGMQSAEPSRAVALAPLHTLITADDYPAEALRNDEEGTVQFRLHVGPDGRVKECLIVESSGSPSLDAGSCSLLTERAHFTPARNAAGEALADIVESRIKWVLDDDTPRVDAATNLLMSCLMGEASKAVFTDLEADLILDRAFETCRPLEERLSSELDLEEEQGLVLVDFVAQMKRQFRSEIVASIGLVRDIFVPQTPETTPN